MKSGEALEKEVEVCKNKRTDFYAQIESIKEKLQKSYVIQNTAKMNYDQMNAKKNDINNMIGYIRKRDTGMYY